MIRLAPGPVEGPRGPGPLFDGPQWSWQIHHPAARLEMGRDICGSEQ